MKLNWWYWFLSREILRSKSPCSWQRVSHFRFSVLGANCSSLTSWIGRPLLRCEDCSDSSELSTLNSSCWWAGLSSERYFSNSACCASSSSTEMPGSAAEIFSVSASTHALNFAAPSLYSSRSFSWCMVSATASLMAFTLASAASDAANFLKYSATYVITTFSSGLAVSTRSDVSSRAGMPRSVAAAIPVSQQARESSRSSASKSRQSERKWLMMAQKPRPLRQLPEKFLMLLPHFG
mmetsp:Transcript_37087/g.54508  ORF Transcript_37087/g.54508 Transcript_37087/m.54508 type:complete len:237 (-) Transcript_37087:556-1266(-)